MKNTTLIALFFTALFFTQVKADEKGLTEEQSNELFSHVQDYCLGKACQSGVFYYHIEKSIDRYCDSLDYVLQDKRKRGYLEYIVKQVQAENAPEELIGIPLAETGLRPKVPSSAGALGMWQFKAKTARDNGLIVNETTDERLDWRASTKAGILYTSRLTEAFNGDTALGVLAYNVGIGNLRKAIKSINSTSAFVLAKGVFSGREGEHYLNKVYGYSLVYYHPQVCKITDKRETDV